MRRRRENSGPPRLCCLPTSDGSVVPVARCQEVIHHKISYIIAQPLTGRKVEEEMHPSKEAAQRCFFRSCREAGERAIHTRQDFRSYAELEMVVVEKRDQHLRPGRA